MHEINLVYLDLMQCILIPATVYKRAYDPPHLSATCLGPNTILSESIQSTKFRTRSRTSNINRNIISCFTKK